MAVVLLWAPAAAHAGDSLPDKPQRLLLLGKVWAQAKFFHPTIATTNVDWDGALLAAIPKVEAAKTVAELRRCERFSYHPGIVVRTLRETVDHVTVKGHHLATRAPFEGRAERVYLAAGAIPTTGILLRSLGVYDRPLAMKDSQYFLLPLVMPRGVPGVRHERLHTLSQIFMEVIDPAVSRHAIHLQIYSYCDPIGKAVRRAMVLREVLGAPVALR